MPRQNNNPNTKKFPLQGRSAKISYRRPFWLPTISYYFLSFAVSITIFFLIWGILAEGGEDTPWITAGVLASVLLICAVVLREIFLRKARNEYLLAKRQLDFNLSKLPIAKRIKHKRSRFSLQQNTFIINQIREKSEAAQVLNNLPDGHFEVFEICNEYLNFTNKELRRIDVNSPRYLAVKKGRTRIKKLHRFHLLTWAELETKKYTREAKNLTSAAAKIETAQKAVTILDSAMKFYPNEENLAASFGAVTEYIARTKISELIEEAERSAFKKDFAIAISKYRDVLFILPRENLSNRDKINLAERIDREIEMLRLLKEGKNDFAINSE